MRALRSRWASCRAILAVVASVLVTLALAPSASARTTPLHLTVLYFDFTSYLCDASKCPSVIGGVLVRKDGSHLTRAFAATLGPFVLRSVR